MIRLRYDKLDIYQFKNLRNNLIDMKTKGIVKLEKIALKQYRDYLDSLGYIYATPRYKYNEEDTTTWKYLDSHVRIDNRGHFRVIEVLNPSYRGL